MKAPIQNCLVFGKEERDGITYKYQEPLEFQRFFFVGPSLGPSQQYLQNSSLIFIIIRHMIFKIW